MRQETLPSRSLERLFRLEGETAIGVCREYLGPARVKPLLVRRAEGRSHGVATRPIF